MTERAAGEAMTEAKRQEADAGLLGKASIDWDHLDPMESPRSTLMALLK